MDESTLLSRITVRKDVFDGKPIVRDLRISVESILSMLGQGMTEAELLVEHPELEIQDIRACLIFAKAIVGQESLTAVRVAS
jgi:uncharacterized protein (DUF433 family)